MFSPYYAPHVGGVESYVAELNHAWLRAEPDLRITIAAPRLPPVGAEHERLGDSVEILRYPAAEPITNFPVPRPGPGLARMLRHLRHQRPDAVFCHTRFFVPAALGLAFAKAQGITSVHVEHGSEHVQLDNRAHGAIALTYDRLVGRQVLRRASAVVAVSSAAAAFVERLAGRSAEVLHRGLPPAVTAGVPADVELTTWAKGRPLVVYVGRLIDGKGVADLLEALGWASAPICLCLVGEGPRRRDLERRAAELGLSGRVRFLGGVSHPAALQALRAADVVVNPSYTEGLPTVVLEAAALGRAVVATDVGGTREIITHEETGLLVAPREPQLLAKALERLACAPGDRARLGGAARRRAREAFSWDVTANRLLELARCG